MPLHTDLVNACTYFWGLVGLICAMLCIGGFNELYSELMAPAAWVKLRTDPYMMASVGWLVVFGILCAYLLKELSNIVKEVSGAFVVITCLGVQWMIQGNSAITATGIMAMTMAFLGISTYNTDPFANNLPAPKKEAEITKNLGEKAEDTVA